MYTKQPLHLPSTKKPCFVASAAQLAAGSSKQQELLCIHTVFAKCCEVPSGEGTV